jgi:hypothetical protein
MKVVLKCWENRNTLICGTVPYKEKFLIIEKLIDEANKFIQMTNHSDDISINDLQNKTIPG